MNHPMKWYFMGTPREEKMDEEIGPSTRRLGFARRLLRMSGSRGLYG
jgi:hypothetical protein